MQAHEMVSAYELASDGGLDLEAEAAYAAMVALPFAEDAGDFAGGHDVLVRVCPDGSVVVSRDDWGQETGFTAYDSLEAALEAEDEDEDD